MSNTIEAATRTRSAPGGDARFAKRVSRFGEGVYTNRRETRFRWELTWKGRHHRGFGYATPEEAGAARAARLEALEAGGGPPPPPPAAWLPRSEGPDQAVAEQIRGSWRATYARPTPTTAPRKGACLAEVARWVVACFDACDWRSLMADEDDADFEVAAED